MKSYTPLEKDLIELLYELRDRLQMGQDRSGNSSINQDEIDLINDALTKAGKFTR